MSPVSPRRSGGLITTSPSTIVSIAVVVAVVLVVVLVGLPRLRSQAPSTAGLVPVPTAALPIAAHTRIRRDHLWDRANSRIAVVYLPPRAVTKEMLLNIGDIIGRVLDGDKQPGYVFTEDDFLPRGTREGLVAGIPAGKRALRISADRVEGLFGLNAGDRFDIVATMPIDAANGGGRTPNFSGPYSPELALQAQLSNWDKQATVRVIVQNASVVEPMLTRGVQTIQTTVQGAAARTRAVQEAVIAIEPREVALLTEAMAVEAHLASIPRSGRPDDPVESKTPDLRPFSPFAAPGDPSLADNSDRFAVVETIMGQKRALMAVPRP
jgi:Flp pilus assembly protein CpaB